MNLEQLENIMEMISELQNELDNSGVEIDMQTLSALDDLHDEIAGAHAELEEE